MVMPGQFLERPTLIDVGGLCLEALWHRGTRCPALLILAPHPRFGGGSMDAPLCLELAFAATRQGHPTLRFNWRGVCASQGEMGGPEEALEDARHALSALRANVGHDRVAVAGQGLGAEVACALAREEGALEGLLLAAPAVERWDAASLSGIGADVCLVLPGAGGRQGHSLRDRAERCAAAPNVAIEVVPEADASFCEGLVQVGEVVARFLAARDGRAGVGLGPWTSTP